MIRDVVCSCRNYNMTSIRLNKKLSIRRGVLTKEAMCNGDVAPMQIQG